MVALIAPLAGCAMANQTRYDDMRYAQKKQVMAAAMQECANQGVPKDELAACAANDIQLREKQITTAKNNRNTGIAAGAIGAAGIAAALWR